MLNIKKLAAMTSLAMIAFGGVALANPPVDDPNPLPGACELVCELSNMANCKNEAANMCHDGAHNFCPYILIKIPPNDPYLSVSCTLPQ